MKLFLASALDHVRDLFIEKIGDINWKKIWFISNPADLSREWTIDPRWVKWDKDMLFSLWWNIVDIDLRETKDETLFGIISSCDILYVSGWNTRYFKELADSSGFQKIIDELIIKKWLLYVSTSAGSCVMWTSIKYLDPGNFQIEKWYWLINAMILPHWWSEDFKQEYEDTMPKIYNDKQSVITLNNNQAIYADNNWYQILWK